MSGVGSYYRLTKPGIIRGNLITVVAGYMLASKGVYDIGVLAALCLGSGLIIASGCVLNNIFDIDIDSLMERTQKRELVLGSISTKNAALFAIVLGVIGGVILAKWTNILTVLMGVTGLVTYAFVYTYAKRKTHWSTLIGTVPGATPPVAGYVAVTGRFDLTALLLFLVLVTWQMPHFLAIAIRRLKEYKAAHIPLLPIVKGIRATKRQIALYIIGFVCATVYLGIHELGRNYTVLALANGLMWLYVAMFPAKNATDEQWAKKVFFISLLTLLVFDILISLSHYLALLFITMRD
jgi:protoheme IX farnesyltransferase